MSDWTYPRVTLLDDYDDVITFLRDRDEDSLCILDTRRASASNIPTYAKRWNNTNKYLETWNGSTWDPEVISIAGGGTGATSAANARVNLGNVPTASEAQATAQGLVDTHAAVQTAGVHGGQSASSGGASKLVQRDTAGKAQVTTPVSSDPATTIATKEFAESVAGQDGTYAPTVTAETNLEYGAAYGSFYYVRNGDVVQVWGQIFVKHTAYADTHSYLGISLPIPSNIQSDYGLSGVMNDRMGGPAATRNVPDGIIGDVTNDRAKASWYANQQYGWFTVHFAYRVL